MERDVLKDDIEVWDKYQGDVHFRSFDRGKTWEKVDKRSVALRQEIETMLQKEMESWGNVALSRQSWRDLMAKNILGIIAKHDKDLVEAILAEIKKAKEFHNQIVDRADHKILTDTCNECFTEDEAEEMVRRNMAIVQAFDNLEKAIRTKYLPKENES